MKRGRKQLPPAVKAERGTFEPGRDAGRTEVLPPGFTVATPQGLPQKPDWLTDAGGEVWLDDVGRVSTHKMATESDSTMFAQYCNLQGAINMAWRAGSVPPAAHLMEARRMAEQFGLFGRKSRIISGGLGTGEASNNPFNRLKK